MDLDPQWMNLALLVLLLVSQIGRWSKRAEERTTTDSMRPVFVSRELYDSQTASTLERVRRLERKVGINGDGE